MAPGNAFCVEFLRSQFGDNISLLLPLTSAVPPFIPTSFPGRNATVEPMAVRRGNQIQPVLLIVLSSCPMHPARRSGLSSIKSSPILDFLAQISSSTQLIQMAWSKDTESHGKLARLQEAQVGSNQEKSMLVYFKSISRCNQVHSIRFKIAFSGRGDPLGPRP